MHGCLQRQMQFKQLELCLLVSRSLASKYRLIYSNKQAIKTISISKCFKFVFRVHSSLMLCLSSLYLPPQQFSCLRLSGTAEHSQLEQGHARVSGLCFDNQRCICSCWLLHIHWLHSRYHPEIVNYTLNTSNVMGFLYPFSGDIFENYCKDDNLATFGRFCFGLSIITTFPLECFVTREVKNEEERENTHKKMCLFACSSVSLQVVSNVICSRKLSRVEHAGLTVLILTVCTSISLAFECLGVVLELNVSCCLRGSVAFNDCL